MTTFNDNIRVVIPLTIRRRNGRPKILPPDDVLEQQVRGQDAHLLNALGRAWAWKRRFENGEAATVHDIAQAEGFTDRYISRMMRLAYLSPNVLERLLISRDSLSVSVKDLILATYLPWTEEMAQVFAQTVPPRSFNETASLDPRPLPGSIIAEIG